MSKDQSKNQPKTPRDEANEFIKEYEALCEKHGMQIQVTPAWKVSQDTGDWRLVLQSHVAKLPKQVE